MVFALSKEGVAISIAGAHIPGCAPTLTVCAETPSDDCAPSIPWEEVSAVMKRQGARDEATAWVIVAAPDVPVQAVVSLAEELESSVPMLHVGD